MKSNIIALIPVCVSLILSFFYLGCGEPGGGEEIPDNFISEVEHVETVSIPVSLDFNGDTLFVAEQNNGFSAYDISNPSSVTLINAEPEAGNCKKLHVENRFNALFVSTETQTYVYYLDSLTLNGNSTLGDQGSDYILTSIHYGEVDDEGEIWITDFMKVFKADGLSSFHQTKVFMDTTDFGYDGIWYFEVEADATYLDWQIPIIPWGLSFVNDNTTVAVSLREEGVGFADVSGDPVWISDVDTPGIAREMVQEGNYLYVADSYFGVAIVNISDVNNPVYLKNIKSDGIDHVLKVTVANNKLVLMDEYDGLAFFDISNPELPVEIGQLKIREPTDLKFNPEDDYLYVTSFERGITVFELLY